MFRLVALLVRPDRHISWRATTAPDDIGAELHRVLTTVLGCPDPAAAIGSIEPTAATTD